MSESGVALHCLHSSAGCESRVEQSRVRWYETLWASCDAINGGILCLLSWIAADALLLRYCLICRQQHALALALPTDFVQLRVLATNKHERARRRSWCSVHTHMHAHSRCSDDTCRSLSCEESTCGSTSLGLAISACISHLVRTVRSPMRAEGQERPA